MLDLIRLCALGGALIGLFSNGLEGAIGGAIIGAVVGALVSRIH
ncbi:MAG: hypothetical protein ABIH28_04180 [archaeon]